MPRKSSSSVGMVQNLVDTFKWPIIYFGRQRSLTSGYQASKWQSLAALNAETKLAACLSNYWATESVNLSSLANEPSRSVKVFYPPFSRGELITLLRQRVSILQGKLPLKRVVLFGSYAQGKQTVASDIDLLIVYAGKPREDAYALVKRTLGVRRLEPHVYAEEEYERVKATLERMIEGGIPMELG